MENPNLDNIVLALLFASDEPLTARKIAAIVEDVTVADVKQAIDTWNQRADSESWSIGIEQVAGGYRVATRPEYAAYVSRLYSGRRKLRLSRAGLETLAIIAYKQPVTRAEIEVVRGVGCGSTIANLLERTLIEIVGKAKVLGAPFLYGTTQEFLEYLGLNSIKDLPSLEDLEALLATEPSDAAEAAVDGIAAEAPFVDSDADDDDVAVALDALASTLEDTAGSTPASAPGDDAGEPLPVASSATFGLAVEEPVNRPLYADVKKRKSAQPADTEPPAPVTAEGDTEEDAEDYRE
ncbi:MAG TPA: SMC-Scp complex subunit ScpB [Candidatus Krumholzibacteria bacterium]|nr:SMC-Scp complex subunit ScpB [Candidatus Krumholzibacteria bacterium]